MPPTFCRPLTFIVRQSRLVVYAIKVYVPTLLRMLVDIVGGLLLLQL